jgi:hypothetical protein
MPGVSHNEILHAYNRAKNTYSGGSLAGYSLMDAESTKDILEDIEKAFGVLGNPSKRREYDLEMGFHTWNEEKQTLQSPVPESPKSGYTPTVRSRGSTILESHSESEGTPLGLTLTALVDEKPKIEKLKTEPETPRTIIPMKAHLSPAAPEVPSTKFEPNREFEEKIKNCNSIDGAFLRAVRVYRGYSVDALAHRTKLTSSHIHVVENEGPESELPALVYLRGHVVLVAQALGLPEAHKLATSYTDKLKAQGKIRPKAF